MCGDINIYNFDVKQARDIQIWRSEFKNMKLRSHYVCLFGSLKWADPDLARTYEFYNKLNTKSWDKIEVFGDMKMGISRYGSKMISWVRHWIQNSWDKHEAFRLPIPISEIQSHWTSKSTSKWTSNQIESNKNKTWSSVNVCVCACKNVTLKLLGLMVRNCRRSTRQNI